MAAKHKPAHDDPDATCRIRQRDTGAVRVMPSAQWHKDEKTLRAQGFVPVDEDDQPLPDEDEEA
jgi:hypothetical protein